ncbi:hypothetical protein [Demequina oxidasica]|uniref:hypothetical protein n=1 Tax=Demequina oxidasica TaxID=676199 RepID=UPI000784D949|nr:hypothetical protein [Demequina oxidasica]
MSDYLTTASVLFSVDVEQRTIEGLLLPFGVVGANGQGKFLFDAKTEAVLPKDVSRFKLNLDHGSTYVAHALELSATDQGLRAKFKVARGPEGDRALSLAEDGVYDGLSAELSGDSKFTNRNGVMYGTRAVIKGAALTPIPAFDDARVTSVAASAATEGKEPDMGDTPTEVEAPDALDFTALGAKVDDLATKFAEITLPPREEVPAGHTFSVTEPLPYRFDGQAGEHEFSTDLFAATIHRNGEAAERLQKFLNDVNFAAVDSGDVTGLNPSRYRPDLYVDQAVKATPVTDAISMGGLTDATPFVVPKFSSSSGEVADHTEGTEPSGAAFTATSQTVTPTAVSGLAEVTREVVDAGGNPQVSALLWTQMTRAYANAIEMKAAAFLNGLTLTELGTAVVAGDTLSGVAAKVEAALAGLVFVDGGEYFTRALASSGLYGDLTTVTDSTGRRLYPQIAPTNANGTTADKYRRVNVGGYDLIPAGSLGTTAKKSYVFDPAFGGIWHSGATRIALPETVALGLRFGIWGYQATAALDTSKIRKITWIAHA